MDILQNEIEEYWEYAELNLPYTENTWKAQKYEALGEFEIKNKSNLGGQFWVCSAKTV